MIKNEWKWILAFVASSLLVYGLLTGFAFSTIEVQLHDTYVVIEGRTFLFYFTAFQYILAASYRLVDLGTRTNRIFALVVSFTFPIGILLLGILLGLYVKTLAAVPGGLVVWLPVVVLVLVLLTLIILAARAIRRAWSLATVS